MLCLFFSVKWNMQQIFSTAYLAIPVCFYRSSMNYTYYNLLC